MGPATTSSISPIVLPSTCSIARAGNPSSVSPARYTVTKFGCRTRVRARSSSSKRRFTTLAEGPATRCGCVTLTTALRSVPSCSARYAVANDPAPMISMSRNEPRTVEPRRSAGVVLPLTWISPATPPDDASPEPRIAIPISLGPLDRPPDQDSEVDRLRFAMESSPFEQGDAVGDCACAGVDEERVWSANAATMPTADAAAITKYASPETAS